MTKIKQSALTLVIRTGDILIAHQAVPNVVCDKGFSFRIQAGKAVTRAYPEVVAFPGKNTGDGVARKPLGCAEAQKAVRVANESIQTVACTNP